MSERWIIFDEAVELIRTGLDASKGRSQSVLQKACAAAEIRARRLTYSTVGSYYEFIPARAWTDGAIDEHGQFVLSFGLGPKIEISEADLRDVLDRHRPSPATAEPPRVHPKSHPASDVDIRREILAVYDEADRGGLPAPNIRKLPKLVRARLKVRGLDSSDNHIQEIGSADEFKCRRRPTGRTLASERK
jgi:hypothetical protein